MLLGIRWGSLRTKIVAWVFVPTAIILVAVALVAFIAYQRVTGELVIQRDQDVTRLSAGQIATELGEYPDLLTSLARTSTFYRGNPAVQRAALQSAANRITVFNGGALILDTFGTVVAAEPEQPDLLGQDWSQHACYRGVLSSEATGSGRWIFSDIISGGPQANDAICVAVPITGERGEFVGALVGLFRLGASTTSAFYGEIVKLRLAESGSITIVDSSGRSIYDSDTNRIGKDLSQLPSVQQALKGQVSAVRTRDALGQLIVASYAPVPGTPWFLIIEEDWATLTQSSRSYERFLLVLLALGLGVPMLVVVLGVRSMTRPIQELIGAAQKVAGGDFGQTITADTGDEIEQLASQFNLMSAQLRESYAQLERRVAEQTSELAALNSIAVTVSQSLDMGEILGRALDMTLNVVNTDAGGIYVLDERSKTLRIAAQRGLPPGFVDAIDNLTLGEGFSGQVAASGEPIVVRDLATDPRLTRLAVLRSELRSMIVVPLASKRRIQGTLFTLTRGTREFGEHHVQQLSSIAGQIGVAIENARLFEREQRRAEQFRVIGEVGRHITSILDVNQLLDEIAASIKEAFGYEMVTIAVIEGENLVFKAGRKVGWPGEFLAPLKVGREGITGWVAGSGEPLLVPDVSREPRYVPWPDSAKSGSELAVPMKTASGTVGVLSVESDRLSAFDSSDVEVLQALAYQAGIAIENARLYEQAAQFAVLEERARLARELHDAVTQTLFSASLIAEALPAIWESDPAEGQQLMRDLRQLNRGALAEMRTLLMELRPTALAESRLGDLLRQLADTVTGRTGIPVAVSVERTCVLPREVHIALYRIAQEALNNVVKHARATEVSIALRCGEPTSEEDAGRSAELHVHDNGCGFDPSCVPPERLGMGIMHERAAAIGADLTIASTPGLGTDVTVIWDANWPAASPNTL